MSVTYSTHSGLMRQRSETFKGFGGALHCYKLRAVSSVDGASITNDDRCGEDTDGLTDDEREAIELADIVVSRWRRLRRRAADRLVETAIAKFKADPWSTEELEAGAALEMARKRDERLVEWAYDKALTVAFPGVTWHGRNA